MPRTPRGKRIVAATVRSRVAAKNPNGDGSVYYEAPRRRTGRQGNAGRWRATYRDEHGTLDGCRGPHGPRRSSGATIELAAIERMPMRGSRFSPGTTVDELTDWWLDSVARHQVKTSTLDSYRKFAGYLADDLGSLPVVDVGPETLTTWQSALLDRFAPYTVLNCRKVCRQAFAEAVKVGLIPSNPFDLVKAPRATRVKAGRALDTDDAKALITAAQDLATRCRRHVAVRAGLARQRSPRPRLGGPRPRRRHRTDSTRSGLHTIGRVGARFDQDLRC